MRLTIATKAVLTVGLLIAFSLTLVGLFLERRERSAIIAQTAARLDAQASLLAAEVADGLPPGDPWARRASSRTNARITAIAADGRVLADSEERAGQMENHADRPEVIQALATESGQATRVSRSVGRELLYFARVVHTGGGGLLILRLAIPLGEAVQGWSEFRRDFLLIALISLLAASGVAILLAHREARQLRQMLAFARGVPRGDMTARLATDSRDELGDLAEALNAMAAELKATLQRRETEERRLRTIMENMGEGLLVLDAAGRVSLVNPAAGSVLGLTGDAILGQTALEAVRSHELYDLIKAAAEDAGPVRAEITLLPPRRRILAGTAVAMRSAVGALQGTVVALRDITQLKRLEEVRMEFVMNVSHELRTPLTAIRGYTETLLDGGLQDKENAHKFLDIVQRHAERLSRLLDDLLDLSDIELDRTRLQRGPVPLPDVVRQVVALLTAKAEKKSIRLDVSIPDGIPPVLADRDRLIQILVNLVDNAVKYTPEGGAVTVGARPAPEGGGAGEQGSRGAAGRPMLEIFVSDTGIGIPQKDLPRLTERFYRVDKTRSRELGGTGLGLAIVKHIVAAHEGSLAIESTPGKGTLIRIRIPTAPGSSAPTP
jgi:two-component system, OmpR family, phosphate regulon sensor histidine kinase PhoR